MDHSLGALFYNASGVWQDVFMAFDRITVEPSKMGRRPCIRGMRITVATVLGQLAAGQSIEDVLTSYPYLEREDVLAALEFAAAMVDQPQVLPVHST